MPILNSRRALFPRSAPMLLIAAALSVGVSDLRSQVPSTRRSAVFVGTSPADEPIRQLLQIPSDPKPEIIQWKLTLHQDEKALVPTRYELRYDYGLTAPGVPGLARTIKIEQRQGAWSKSKGTKSNSGATVFDLSGAFSLLQVDDNVLHLLNPDRSLMVGDGGWSYSLNRADRAEKRVDPALTLSEPDISREVLPLATGPAVFGVFEGRSPCKKIAGQLQIPAHAACMKAKWRITLFQNAETLAPTTYRVEGTLYPRSAVEGNWTRIRGHQNAPEATVYRLTPSSNGPTLYLLMGDNNVLFFLSRNQQPLVGNLDFSYTLNRRIPPGRS